MSQSRTRQINIAIPADIEERLRQEAEDRATSIAAVVREILIRHYRPKKAA